MDKTDRDERTLPKAKEIEQLETLAFHFTQLSKRLSQDREHWAETGKDLSKTGETLNQIIQALAGLEKELKDQVTAVLQHESQEAAQALAKACRDTTQQVLREQIKTTADHLREAVDQASNTLAVYQREKKSLKGWFLMSIILSTFLGNILVGVMVYYLFLS